MRYLDDRHVAGLLDPVRARTIVLEALGEIAAGQAAPTTPPGILARRAEVTYHAKGAYLTGRGIAGFRLAGFPKGPAAPGGRLQMLVLTDYTTTTPHAVIQSESLHPLRVGAAIAVAVERLRASGARTLAMLGAGRLARATIEAIQATTPFDTVRVAASSLVSAARFCASIGRGTQPTASAGAAVHDADVIVTLTSVDEPLVQPEWCKPGSLVVSAGARQECAEQTILQAERIFVDDWAQCSAIGDIGVLVKRGRIRESDVESLAAVCAGTIPGRANDQQRLIAVPQGLAVLDIAIGQAVYEVARERGLGIDLLGL